LQKSGIGAYRQKRATLRVMVASRLKVSFDQMAAPVPEITDGFLYFLCY
jgi:hypothetical protein